MLCPTGLSCRVLGSYSKMGRTQVPTKTLRALGALTILLLNGCGTDSKIPQMPVEHILFVGDSFTHGRYLPIRLYNSGGTQSRINGSALVFDENFGATGARQESATEYGPYGGIPGIFAELAFEAGIPYDVHIEAISMTSLHDNYEAASEVIDQARWNTIVLQELSSRPLPYKLTGDPTSDPASFCKSVQTIERSVHSIAPNAHIYLYETWARADLAERLSGDPSSPDFSSTYRKNLTTLGNANHDAYYSAASHDPAITGVAPTGDAWLRAWQQEVANPDPFVDANASLPSLWYGLNQVNEPQIRTPDYLHPGIYGAYLDGLVLFEEITGRDVRMFGANEIAATALGIPAGVTVQLQQISWEAVTEQNPALIDPSVDPCTIPH